MCDCNNLEKKCQPPNRMGIIYKITNILNGKIYVGQTKRSLEIRMKEHCNSKRNDGLEGAIKKYGIKNFKIEIVEECPVEMLNEREIYWIAFYDCKSPNGYNLTDGGEGLENPTQETIYKISANHADVSGENNPNFGKHHSKETCKKISESKQGSKNPNYGNHRPCSKETRKKISNSNKGRPSPNKGKKFSKETCDRISESKSGENHPFFGKHLSQKHRDNISVANKGKPSPNKGKPRSKATRDKIAAGQKARWEKIRAEKAAKILENIGE